MPPPKNGFSISWPSWTASDAQSTPLHKLSARYQLHLFDIAVLFHDIDLAILREIQFDRDFYKDYNKENTVLPRSRSLFNEDCPNLQAFEQTISKREITGHNIHDLDITALIGTEFNNIWSLAATSLLEFQGLSGNWELNYAHHLRNIVAKERSRIILDTRSDILELFEDLEDELIQQNLGYIWSGIRSRIRSLDGFEGVYNNSPVISDGRYVFEAYVRPSKSPKKHPLISVAYQQGQQNRNATIIAVVFAISLLGFIPTIFAWHRATNLPGSFQDVDFWLLLQSSIMQLLGIFTAMFPIYKHAKSHAWIWAQAFTIFGALCSIASIPLYRYAPTMWSALFSFFGSAAQAGMALLIALMADAVALPLKDE